MKEKEDYINLEIEILEVITETGFAISTPDFIEGTPLF